MAAHPDSEAVVDFGKSIGHFPVPCALRHPYVPKKSCGFACAPVARKQLPVNASYILGLPMTGAVIFTALVAYLWLLERPLMRLKKQLKTSAAGRFARSRRRFLTLRRKSYISPKEKIRKVTRRK